MNVATDAGRAVASAPAELLPERFSHWVTSTPAAIAVECGAERLTYAELEAAAGALSAGLAAAGVGPGDRVALLLPASLNAIIAMLAVSRLRAAYLPLDPAAPQSRLRSIVADCAPALCLTAESNASWPLPELCPAATCAQLCAAAPAVAAGPRPALLPDDLAYILYTSGSTGAPKGVCVTHASLAGLYIGIDGFAASREDCWSQLHALTFGYAQWEIWGALSHGGRLCIVPPEQRTEPARWDQLLRAAGVTVMSLTPSGLRQWLAADLSALTLPRYLILSGEPLQDDVVQHWFARQNDSGVRLLNTYALTETSGCVASHELVSVDAPADCLGQPVAAAEFFIMDPERRESAAVGELWVAGPMLAAGYHAAPELTAERFIAHDPGDGVRRRCYRTGDIVRRDTAGRLRYIGRADGQVKLRGHRVELAEIERSLQAHPAIEAAVVVVSGTAAQRELRAFAVPAGRGGDTALQFWPSLGAYQIYDALLYDLMAADATRVASYQRALERAVAGKVVLDIGTGKDALLARLCADAGARHVYAVEVLDDAAAAARELIAQLGLAQQITVLSGAMDTVQLPEPIEVCTQGIVGNIGSSDGIVPIWNAARRWFAPECVPVPERCVTWIAPAELPAAAGAEPRFGPLAADYVRRVFAREGREFDVRLCVRNLPPSSLLAAPAEFEQLDFRQELAPGYTGAADFAVLRDARLDGLVLWTRLHNGTDAAVDFLQHQQAWLPVWFPLQASVDVRQGDVIRAEWTCVSPAAQVFPDYTVTVTVQGAAGPPVESRYVSRHHETQRGATALHRQLLQGLDNVSAAPDGPALRAWLAERLPEYMLPRSIRLLAELPLNASRKVDFEALRALPMQGSTPAAAPAFASALEAAVADIWSAALDVATVAPDANFFDLGGDSITAVRLTTAVQRYLDTTVFLTTLYEAPTVALYCAALEQRHGAALQERGAAGDGADAAMPSAGGGQPDDDSRLLSYAQQSLWFLQQLYPNNTAGNEQFVLRLTAVDFPRVRAAWNALLSRHDILRTYFVTVAAGEPRQLVAADPVAEQSEADLRAASESALLRLAAAEIARPFELSQLPLLRVVWARTAVADWALIVTAHHIIADGLCMALIRDELLALYAGASLPAPQRYHDFVAAQRRQVGGKWLAGELTWWRAQLDGVALEPPATMLPDAAATAPERRVAFAIDAACADALRQLARQAGVSLFVVLAAAWRVWVARCRGTADCLLGTPVTLRTTAATAEMLGCLVNNVALRNPLDWHMPFSALLRSEHGALLAAREHAAVPFEQVVAAVDAPRILGRHPLFQVFLQYEQVAAPAYAADGAGFHTDVLPVDRASYWDMELAVRDAGEGAALEAFFGFRSDLYPRAELETWPAGLTALLHAAVAAPEQPIGELPLLSSRQQAQRGQWNATDWPVPAGSLAGLFVAQARRSPAAPALRCAESGLWTYAELQARCERYAAALAARGIAKDSRVGVALQMQADTVALLLAINHLGALWVPLDPDYPADRRALMLEVARPQLLITDAGAAATTCASVTRAELRAAAEAGSGVAPAAVHGSHWCALFTSGSTGTPKGALVAQPVALSRCLWMWSTQGFTTASLFAQRTSLNFIDSLWEIFGPLLHGAAVALPPSAARRDARELAAWVGAAGVEHLVVVPALLQELLQHWGAGDSGPPAQLQVVICSGETLAAELVAQFSAALPHCRLLNTYGTSETWDITVQRVDDLERGVGVPVGAPVANTQVRILDSELRPLPLGVIGTVYAACPVAPAYLHDPALTAQQLRRLRASDLDWYCTGDLGYWDVAGRLHLAGRGDRQLKLRGVRIEPGDVEAVALSCPAVQAAALTRTVESVAAGSQGWLTLYLVAAVAPEPSLAVVRDWLRAHLPPAFVPADLIFVPKLPRTPSGKLDVDALAAAAPSSQQTVPAEITVTESKLLRIWQAALERDDISLQDDFFALRGNSLLATRVIARVCDEFAVELPLAALFAAPTIAGLAQTLDLLAWSLGVADDRGADGRVGEREVVRL